MKKIKFADVTLRDGSHAVKHQLTRRQIEHYVKALDGSNVDVIEIGHGNGIGASSLLVGESLLTDTELIETARKCIQNSKLGIFCLPGFATIKKDLKPAFELGVDAVKVASHCTEANLTQRHIEFARENDKDVYGVLMMSHMIDKILLLEQAKLMQSYGAQGVILMDSAGAYLINDVKEKVTHLVENLDIQVGFHAHNNLGLAVANSVIAVENGATYIDACARGFGAGAGNAQIEILVAVLDRMGYQTGIDFDKITDAVEIAEKEIIEVLPVASLNNIISGLAGVFSGFSKHVERVSREFNVSTREIFFELGRKKIIAGQEDVIIEVAMDLAKNKQKTGIFAKK